MLHFKHLVATSSFAGPAQKALGLVAKLGTLKNPELGLLRREDDYIHQLLPRFVKRDSNCLDIGGHIGSFAYQLSQLAPDGKLTIVEADPTKAGWLKQRFGADKVLQAAVSDTPGKASFFVDEERAGFSKLGDGSAGAKGHQVEVDVVRLDDVLDPAPIAFIKIDVEGHEFKALNGARSMLERDRPVILFEAGGRNKANLDDESKALVRWLSSELGYAIYPPFHLIHNRPAISEATFDLYRTYPFACFNYFAIPGEANADEVH
ncbi:MAG: FkbM family methyltransferase [Pseudomonadota bacterium]